MNKYLFILLLLVLNAYANKNWIKIDDINPKSEVLINKDLKKKNSKSSLKGISNLDVSNETQNTNSTDKDLLQVLKEIKNVTQSMQSKIKK